jgi:hypothetical protein
MSQENFRSLREIVRFTILKAPDRFPPDLNVDVTRCFADIYDCINAASPNLNGHGDELKRLARKSESLYLKGVRIDAAKELVKIDEIIESLIKDNE